VEDGEAEAALPSVGDGGDVQLDDAGEVVDAAAAAAAAAPAVAASGVASDVAVSGAGTLATASADSGAAAGAGGAAKGVRFADAVAGPPAAQDIERVKDTGGYSGTGFGPAARAKQAELRSGGASADVPASGVDANGVPVNEPEPGVRVGKRLLRRALRVPRTWRDKRGNLPRETTHGTTMPADADLVARAMEFAGARVGVFRSRAEIAAANEARRKVEATLAEIAEEEGRIVPGGEADPNSASRRARMEAESPYVTVTVSELLRNRMVAGDWVEGDVVGLRITVYDPETSQRAQRDIPTTTAALIQLVGDRLDLLLASQRLELARFIVNNRLVLGPADAMRYFHTTLDALVEDAEVEQEEKRQRVRRDA
jgi:hypothetical protein